MLEANNVEFRYREYRQDPLDEAEIREVLNLLGLQPVDVLRKKDHAYRELGLDGGESADQLISFMASHPTLLQRPIGVAGGRAVLGRPPERLLELVAGE